MPKARKTLKSLVVGGRKGGAHGARDPLLEISNYEAQHGYDMLTAEADAARPIPKIRSSEVMDRMSRIADNVARFIAVRTLKVAGTAISNPDQVKERVSQLQAQTLRLMKNGQEALAHNYELLLAWAHSYAMTGNGKVTLCSRRFVHLAHYVLFAVSAQSLQFKDAIEGSASIAVV
jgi:hypothetical protein